MEHCCPTASASWLNDFNDFVKPLHLPEMKSCPPATDLDPRHVGWPCHGEHLPGKERSNKTAMWQACSRCGLRLRYVTKGSGHGETRAIGPPPEHVELAQEELKEEFTSMTVTEKIFNGKLMELRGRAMMKSGTVRSTVQVRANEKLGEALMAGASCSGSTVKKTETTRSPSPPKAKNKEKTNPVKEDIRLLSEARASTDMKGYPGKMNRAMSIASEESVEVIKDTPEKKKNTKNEVTSPDQAE